MKGKNAKKPASKVSDVLSNSGEQTHGVTITPKHHKKPKKVYE